MTYFHSYWTRPVLDPARTGAEQELLWWDFEALTWLWSALELRQHGPLKLVTDDRGLLAVQRAGLDRKSTRLNSSHSQQSRMPSSA